MEVKLKRMLLFLFGCIGSRCLIAYIAKVINPEYLPYMGYIALIISLSFIYLFLFGNKKADSQLEWSGDKKIWWNNLRVVHGLNYLIFAILAIQKKNNAWIPLAVDVSIGFIAWIIHHTSSGENRLFT
jgi:hypothetical protein